MQVVANVAAKWLDVVKGVLKLKNVVLMALVKHVANEVKWQVAVKHVDLVTKTPLPVQRL